MDPDLTECLYEPAAPDATLWVGGGKTLYVGSLGAVDWHCHGVAVFIAGLTGNFRLGLSDGQWLSCRAAVPNIPIKRPCGVGLENRRCDSTRLRPMASVTS